VSIVIHEYLDKHPTKDELEKAAANAKVSMRHFEEAVKKVRAQKDLKIGQKIAVPYYR
jgi:transitional endoplasmic reticulum ATPase